MFLYILAFVALVLFVFIACRLMRIERKMATWTRQFNSKLDQVDLRSTRLGNQCHYWRMLYFSEEWTGHKQELRNLSARVNELEAANRDLAFDVEIFKCFFADV